MPHNQTQLITHVVDGGWATDFGKNVYVSPQEGELRIPWLAQCENVKFYPDGSFGKYPGLYNLYTAPIKSPASSTNLVEGSQARLLYNYIRMGSSLTGTSKSLAIVGSFLYDITNAPESIVQVGDVLPTATSVFHMTTFNDLLIIGGSTPKSWDQTTFQTLAGTPPAFGFSTHHAGRHWAAGNASAPSRLYYSAVGNPEDWVGAGSGSIDIDPGDGDAITALLSWKKELWVFKGPHRLSIHRITGTTTSDFTRTPFINGISAAGPNAIFSVGDDFGFWSPRGSCHSLTATDAYGDYSQSYLNYPILSWCRNPTNISAGYYTKAWQTVTDRAQNITYSILNNHSLLNPQNSVVLLFDWKFRNESNPYPRIIKLTLGYMSTVGMLPALFNNTTLVPTFGTWDGLIKQELEETAPYYTNGGSQTGAGTAFSYRLQSPALTYGPSYYTKTIHGLGVDFVDNQAGLVKTIQGNLELSVGGRQFPTQTITFNHDGFVGLGTFVLGTDQLGDLGDSTQFSENIAGESTAFTYTLVDNSSVAQSLYSVDTRVNHFSALIAPSGSSMETL